MSEDGHSAVLEIAANSSGDHGQAATATQERSGGEGGCWGMLESYSDEYPSIELVGEEPIVVGRADPRYKLTNTAISNTHFRLWREPTKLGGHGWVFFIEDTSTNGTFLNKERLRKRSQHLLHNDTDVSILDPAKVAGAVTYRFVERCSEQAEIEQGGPQQRYAFGPVLGQGHFAIVRRAKCLADGTTYAMKIMEKSRALVAQSRRDPVKDEANILLNIHHPNIIGVKEIFETRRYFYIVMELVRGGELFDRIVEKQHFDEPTTRLVMRQLLEAVAYLHARGIAHRDIKPENILLAEPDTFVVKLSDFGLSRVFDDSSFMKTMCGTPAYVAPEVLMSAGTGGYTDAVDMWSLGVIMYVMLSGFHPFNLENSEVLFASIKAGNYDFPHPMWDGVSPGAIALIRRLMTVDPARRATAQQALCDPWIVGMTATPTTHTPGVLHATPTMCVTTTTPTPVPVPVFAPPDQQQQHHLQAGNEQDNETPTQGTKRQTPDEPLVPGTAPKKQRT